MVSSMEEFFRVVSVNMTIINKDDLVGDHDNDIGMVNGHGNGHDGHGSHDHDVDYDYL